MSQPSARLGAHQVFTLSGTSQPSSAFGAQTYQIRVATGAQPAWVLIGDGTPVAAATEILMPANWVEYFTVTPGQKIAVFQAGTAGSISVAELSS